MAGGAAEASGLVSAGTEASCPVYGGFPHVTREVFPQISRRGISQRDSSASGLEGFLQAVGPAPTVPAPTLELSESQKIIAARLGEAQHCFNTCHIFGCKSRCFRCPTAAGQ